MLLTMHQTKGKNNKQETRPRHGGTATITC